MAYRASAYFKGNTRKMSPKAQVAGTNAVIFHTHTFNPDPLLAADVLELFPIPPGARVVSITHASENLPVTNVTVGWMSGTPGAPDAARTIGTEFVNAVAAAAADANVALSVLRAQDRSDALRSIGMKVSADITAAANRNITFRIQLQF